ncbi:MAG: hypothetical protein JEZ09_12760 [Salinivirgaceae bacterium]|nr:hypothetical protein [Salinivirgaceae bacterium]
MKQKIIIAGAVLLLIVVVLLMVRDMFQDPTTIESNPYEYKLDNFKDIDSSLFCYKEVKRFNPIIQKLNGIAIDKDDNLYLTGLQKVMIYSKDLEFQKGFKINAEAKNIAVAEDGKIYLGVSDHIEIWDNQGTHLKSWNRFNAKSVLTSIAVGEKSVYLADAGNKVVLEYDFSGKLIREIGKRDTLSDRPGFIIPSPFFDVAIGREGELWAVNSGMHTFETYNSSGELVSSWNRTSMQIDGFSGCCNPSHTAILSDGSFVTSEKGIVRVKIHEPSGEFKCAIAGSAEFTDGTTGMDIAVNSNDDIFIIVPNKTEVRVYKKK